MNTNIEYQHIEYLDVRHIPRYHYRQIRDLENDVCNNGWSMDLILEICRNPNAISLIEKYFFELNDNPHRHTLSNTQHHLLIEEINKNQGAVEFLRNHQEMIDICALAANPNAMDLICSLIKFDSKSLARWHDNDFIEMRRFSNNLSNNPSAIHVLSKNPFTINKRAICYNNGECIMDVIIQLIDNLSKDDIYILLNHNKHALRAFGKIIDLSYIFDGSKPDNLTYDYAEIELSRLELNASIKYHPRFVKEWAQMLLDE